MTNKKHSTIAPTLLTSLQSRLEIAQSFTKQFKSDVETAIQLYEANPHAIESNTDVARIVKRYREFSIIIPYIFATHESMTASFFENLPELIIAGRSSMDEQKASALSAMYDHVKDVADLGNFLQQSAWWFFLCGMTVGEAGYKRQIEGYVEVVDETGNPMTDEGGEVIIAPKYSYNDPIVTCHDLCEVYFSPESKFSYDGSTIPYMFTHRVAECDEIEAVYGYRPEPNTQIISDTSKKENMIDDDIDRCHIYYYTGFVQKKFEKELKEFKVDWAYGKKYKITLCGSKIIDVQEAETEPRYSKFYGSPNSFFGFGLGRTLQDFQKQLSIRKSQMLRHADLYAFPWLAIDSTTKVDQKALMSTEKRTPLVYTGTKPEYIVPPETSGSVIKADEMIQSDAQFVSGTLDLSKGAQQTNTVKTATGQQLFAQSQDKRLNKARAAIGEYYRLIVIDMFKLLRDNWEDHDPIMYPKDDGTYEELNIDKALLDDIDFDSDVDFNLDTISVNKDVISQRWLSLLETSSQLPFADLEKIFEKVLRESFKISNPELYIKSEEEMMQGQMPPGEEGQPPVEAPPNEEMQPPQEESQQFMDPSSMVTPPDNGMGNVY